MTVLDGKVVSNLKEIPRKPGFYTAEGIYIEIMNELKSMLNFTYSLELAPDGTWGKKLPNGSWNGIVNCLMNKEYDLGVTEMTRTMSRRQVISFSSTIREAHYKLFIKSSAEAYNFYAYIHPMQDSFWMALSVFCIMTPFFLFATKYVTVSLLFGIKCN